MELLEAIKKRHSVRSYLDRPIPKEVVAELQAEIDSCNKAGSLHIQLVTNEPKAFKCMMAHYGKFSGVQNYIALIGKDSPDLDEKIGYYGQRVALKAQMLGLNSCWVALTFSKGATKKVCKIMPGEKLACVISVGYGATNGVEHTSKPMTALCKTDEIVPEWFNLGMKSAMLAPTAINQQKFFITQNGNTVSIKATGGFYSKVDLGIVKYHFEIGAGIDNFSWV